MMTVANAGLAIGSMISEPRPVDVSTGSNARMFAEKRKRRKQVFLVS